MNPAPTAPDPKLIYVAFKTDVGCVGIFEFEKDQMLNLARSLADEDPGWLREGCKAQIWRCCALTHLSRVPAVVGERQVIKQVRSALAHAAAGLIAYHRYMDLMSSYCGLKLKATHEGGAIHDFLDLSDLGFALQQSASEPSHANEGGEAEQKVPETKRCKFTT